jgi:hypothetical protein
MSADLQHELGVRPARVKRRPARDRRIWLWVGGLLVLAVLVKLGVSGPEADEERAAPGAVPAASPAAGVQAGWQLTDANTGLLGAGVDRLRLPEFTGRVRAGMTISMKKISSALDLSRTANVTLDRVWLAPRGGTRALVLGSGSVVQDSDIDGSSMARGERVGIYGVVSGSYALSRIQVTGMSVGAWLDGDGTGTLSDSYLHDLVSLNAAHVDGFTRRSGIGSLRILRCRIDASGPGVTGALFLQNTWGGAIAGLEVEHTLLEGEGFVIALENKGAGTAIGLDDVRVRSTGWGPASAAGAIEYTRWDVTVVGTSGPGTRVNSP